MSIGVISAHEVQGGGSLPVTFVERSSDVWTGGGRVIAAHGSALAGDRQILAIASHASVTPATPSGWTLLSRTTTAHSSLTIFTRIPDGSNVGSTITLSSGAHAGVEFRTYRGGSSGFSVRANGTGLTAPSFTVAQWTIRFTAIARDNLGGGGSNGGILTVDSGLSNKTPAFTWQWYGGIGAGDEPTVIAGTAPTRTATDTGTATRYPQWVDVEIA